MTERRCHERYLFTVQANLECGTAMVAGEILDVSVQGARIRLGSRPFLHPDCIVTAADYGVRVAGRVVWRCGSDVGIRFLAEPPAAVASRSFRRRRLQ